MEQRRGGRRDATKRFISVIALCGMAWVVAAPIVNAAVQTVRIRDTDGDPIQARLGALKVRDSAGRTLESKSVGKQGPFDAPGSSGALAVRTFGGGNGFLGAGDCGEAPSQPLPNTVTIPAGTPQNPSIITGIMLGGTDAKLTITAKAVLNAAVPVMRLRANTAHPNEVFALGNGLRVTDDIIFTCSGESDPVGNGHFVIIGQGPGAATT